MTHIALDKFNKYQIKQVENVKKIINKRAK